MAAEEAIARSKAYENYILDPPTQVDNPPKTDQQDSGKDHTTHSKKPTPFFKR